MDNYIHAALAFCDPPRTCSHHTAAVMFSMFGNMKDGIFLHIIRSDTLRYMEGGAKPWTLCSKGKVEER